MNVLGDVRRFMRVAGQEMPEALGDLDPKTIELRRRLIVEEARELDEAMKNHDLVEVADGIADLIYVAVGAALAYGIPLERVWAEVQRSNMAKFHRCSACDGAGCDACAGTGFIAVKDAGGKVQKPPGWTPPDIAKVLQDEVEWRAGKGGQRELRGAPWPSSGETP